MNASSTLKVDVVIAGGGVAGLWLLARLRRAGYQAILVEDEALGSGQTRFAQGIIHGGIKYTLGGDVTASSQAIADMPDRWRACLDGSGELDLSAARLLSEHQYLWSPGGSASKLSRFFASKMLHGRIDAPVREDYPPFFQNPAFKGQLYRMAEPVLDVVSLLRALAEPHKQAIVLARINAARQLPEYQGVQLTLSEHTGENLIIEARRLVLAAGAGNESLLRGLGYFSPPMQLRPLRMVMLRGGLRHDVFGHCTQLKLSATPRLTITSHRDSAGERVWYLGGELAETGVEHGPERQIETARGELRDIFPWLDLSAAQFACLYIDRAEARQPEGRRPESFFTDARGALITAWPTKLALSPLLADEVLTVLARQGITPGAAVALPDWLKPGYAPLPWQEENRWA